MPVRQAVARGRPGAGMRAVAATEVSAAGTGLARTPGTMETPHADLTQSPTVMLAMLETKLRAVLGPLVPGDVPRLQSRQEALRWFLHRDREGTFSFERVCEVTGLDPELFRKRVLRVAALNGMRPRADGLDAVGVSAGSRRRTTS